MAADHRAELDSRVNASVAHYTRVVPGGRVFGSTVLAHGADHGPPAGPVLKVLNRDQAEAAVDG
jgi:hypothetical protein